MLRTSTPQLDHDVWCSNFREYLKSAAQRVSADQSTGQKSRHARTQPDPNGTTCSCQERSKLKQMMRNKNYYCLCTATEKTTNRPQRPSSSSCLVASHFSTDQSRVPWSAFSNDAHDCLQHFPIWGYLQGKGPSNDPQGIKRFAPMETAFTVVLAFLRSKLYKVGGFQRFFPPAQEETNQTKYYSGHIRSRHPNVFRASRLNELPANILHWPRASLQRQNVHDITAGARRIGNPNCYILLQGNTAWLRLRLEFRRPQAGDRLAKVTVLAAVIPAVEGVFPVEAVGVVSRIVVERVLEAPQSSMASNREGEGESFGTIVLHTALLQHWQNITHALLRAST